MFTTADNTDHKCELSHRICASAQVWCDQETAGGGWTMISQARAAKAAATETLCQTKAIGTLDLSNG